MKEKIEEKEYKKEDIFILFDELFNENKHIFNLQNEVEKIDNILDNLDKKYNKKKELK
jgi:uncharacterized protein YlxW (UPF0749 family)